MQECRTTEKYSSLSLQDCLSAEEKPHRSGLLSIESTGFAVYSSKMISIDGDGAGVQWGTCHVQS